MPKIIFYGWNVGMRTLMFCKYLHEKISLSLKESMNLTLKILDEEIQELEVEDPEIAKEIIERASELGVKAGIEI